MRIQCTLDFKYKSQTEARAVAQSVKVDNYNFVNTEVKKSRIISIIVSKSIPSLIHTLDDYLACIGLAERVINKIPIKSN